MEPYSTKMIAEEPEAIAPDGSEVRLLCDLPAGGTAEFRLKPDLVSIPQQHRTVSEIWYVISGHGKMWRRQGEGQGEVVDLEPGLSLTVPVGCAFQFRAGEDGDLVIIGVTMPPWPGEGEAFEVDGKWTPKSTPVS